MKSELESCFDVVNWLTAFSFRAVGLPASRSAITSSRPFRASVIESRFVFVAKLPPSSVAEEILEQGEDFARRRFRLAVHSPHDRLLTSGVGERLAEAEAGRHDESQGLGCQEQLVGQAIVFLKLVRNEGTSREIAADPVHLFEGANRVARGPQIRHRWPAGNHGDIGDQQDRARHLPQPGRTVDDDDLLGKELRLVENLIRGL